MATSMTVSYQIAYSSPTCFDDGGISHDQYYSDYTDKITAASDEEAQRISLSDKYHRREYCRHGRHSHTTGITKTVTETTEDGWERVTTTAVPLPTKKWCACRREYWPILGEKACHELVPIQES